MAIKFTEDNRLTSWCTWHDNEDVNKRQAAQLGADARVTMGKLVRIAFKVRYGRYPVDLDVYDITHREEPGKGLVWVCRGDEAFAVYSHPVSAIKDRRYVLTWHWVTLAPRVPPPAELLTKYRD